MEKKVKPCGRKKISVMMTSPAGEKFYFETINRTVEFMVTKFYYNELYFQDMLARRISEYKGWRLEYGVEDSSAAGKSRGDRSAEVGRKK